MGLDFSNVGFRYGFRTRVLEGLSLSIPIGSTLLLGPNGAGKSTLLGLAASALRPASGEVSFNGLTYRTSRDRRSYRRRVTWMPQQVRPIPGLTVREQVAYVGWLKGLRRRAAWKESGPALADSGLARLENRPATQLSGGQLRRLGVAQCVVHDAELVLMDEPTAGLDPTQRARFRDTLIPRLRSRASLVVSTHQTEDILAMYDRVIILLSGRVVHMSDIPTFLDIAPVGTPSLRRAEAAYTRILSDNGYDSE